MTFQPLKFREHSRIVDHCPFLKEFTAEYAENTEKKSSELFSAASAFSAVKKELSRWGAIPQFRRKAR
jgi:hypothetical protein